MIMDYLRKQNRPYSATDISANLHNAITKTNAAKILTQLSDTGDLAVCVAGKDSFVLAIIENAKAMAGICISNFCFVYYYMLLVKLQRSLILKMTTGKQMVYHIPQASYDTCIYPS